MSDQYKKIQLDLLGLSSEEGREKTEYYFKTGKGTYSEHEEFIGVRMPDVRRVAASYKDLEFTGLKKLLASRIHEERLCALIILVNRMKLAVSRDDKGQVDEICEFYLHNRAGVNNWDLVDVSAHYILGNYMLTFPERSQILYDLAVSDVMWDRRIAMVSQWVMIRAGSYEHVLPLAKMLLADEEDLMHKAVGWMLREYWKRDADAVESFLEENYEIVPRTTLRYAIERILEQKRKNILHKAAFN